MIENINYDKNQNYWIVFIKPFDNSWPSQYIQEFQEKCYEQKAFGMGWNYATDKEFIKIQKLAREMLAQNMDKEEIKKLYKDVFANNAKAALRDFLNIEIGDYVITRFLDGNYYIGKVSQKAMPCDIKEILRFSWYCKVEQWIKFNKYDLPGHIIGRMMQKNHSTIQRIGSDDGDNAIIKHYIYNLFNNTLENAKLEINFDNFTSALSPNDLEDLVYAYIIKENPQYILYPSQCKKDEVKYEFYLVNKIDASKNITCQVKNKEIVEYNKYLEDAKDKNKFEKIYLFSGLEENGYGCIDEENEKIIPIGRKTLYEFLMSDEANNIVLNILKEKLRKFYII